MKQLYILLSLITLNSFSYSQITVTGSAGSTQLANNAPAIVVDPSLAVTTSSSIGGFIVSISSNFSSGDILSFTGSLPSGVTGSYYSVTGVLTFSGSATAANYQGLLRTVTLSTTSTSTSTRTITFRATDGSSSYFSTNGHYYAYVSGSFSWTQAKANAATNTLFGSVGYLVTVTSSAENTFVNALSGKGWIGASDDFSEINTATGTTTFANQAASEGNWYWVTGPEKGTKFSTGSTVITYANYQSGEPNNSASLEHYLENLWSNGFWNDSQVGGPLGYVIEYGGNTGDPVYDIDHSRNVVMVATELRTLTATTSYNLQAAAVVVDNALTVNSTGNIINAKVTVSSNFNSGDVLSYTGTLPSGVTVSGSGYDAVTGVLSFTGTTTPTNWQTLLRTVKFNSTSNVIGNRIITFSVGNLVSFSNGHFYEYVSTGATWATAKTNAAARTYLGLTGYLGTITTLSENDFIRQKLSADAWIGNSDAFGEINTATGVTTYASQTLSEGKFYWVTGPEKGTQLTTGNAASGSVTGATFGSAYNNWNLGEPNNSASEHYGEIYASGTNLGKWNDLNGTGALGYIVEYGGLSTDPALVLSSNTTIVNNSSLPVTGLEMNVQVAGNTATVQWYTLAEIDCDRFDVMHSADGNTFIKIGSIKGAGTSDTRHYYEFIHSGLSYGTHYYKLQQFDIDDKYHFSKVKQVSVGDATTVIFPNPAHSGITISRQVPAAGYNLKVFSLSGALMKSATVMENNYYLNVLSYPAGSYIIRIDDKIKTSRLMFVKK